MHSRSYAKGSSTKSQGIFIQKQPSILIWSNTSATGKQTLSDVIRDFKSFTAKKIMNDIPENSKESRREWMMYLFNYFARKNRRNYEHQFWQSDNHPMLLESVKFIQQKLDYIHKNPIRAGLVNMPSHYLYSSASNYFEDGVGIMEVDILESFYQ